METPNEAFAKMATQIEGWEVRLAAFKSKADAATGEDASELRAQASEMKIRQGSARQYLAEIERAAGAAWKPIGLGIEEKWSRLSTAVEAMWSNIG